jgi:hypothetical protein
MWLGFLEFEANNLLIVDKILLSFFNNNYIGVAKVASIAGV